MATTALIQHMWPPPATEAHSAVLRAPHDTGIRADPCHGVADGRGVTRRWGFDTRLVQPLDDVFAHTDKPAGDAAGSRMALGLAVSDPCGLSAGGRGRRSGGGIVASEASSTVTAAREAPHSVRGISDPVLHRR
ncbi:hypothetical protein ACFCX0_27570 [Streptomyces sp. NPDC056352]|uniref:hypothetical protein n=1 Tax=Streptomyces sp. NPDC056352 TaxID=3345791 RepID=UPI0035D97D56